jgi:hypothetical protein
MLYNLDESTYATINTSTSVPGIKLRIKCSRRCTLHNLPLGPLFTPSLYTDDSSYKLMKTGKIYEMKKTLRINQAEHS